MIITQIESRQNQALRHFARLGREKKYREACDQMLCEGDKMLEEALRSQARVVSVLVREGAQDSLAPLLAQVEARGARLYTAPDTLFSQAGTVQTPQNALCACVRPKADISVLNGAQRVIVLDCLQDPGNLGTILRTAEAFAIDAVILCEGCADPFAPKVVRATMGAVFRLPCIELPLREAAGKLGALELPLYAAALTEDSVPAEKVALGKSAVIIGSEGKGVSAGALELADKHIIIPMKGRAESLNASVAAAILMYRMTME